MTWLGTYSKLAIVAALLFVFFPTVFAQQKSAAIVGKVVDGNGAIVPSASVVLANIIDNKELKRTLTDAEGGYEFSELSPGKYGISVSSSHMANRTVRKHVQVTSAQTIQANFVFHHEPCYGDEVVGTDKTITDEIRAEIVRALIDMTLEGAKDSVILVPRNINTDWLTRIQKSRLSIMTRAEVQALTEKTKNRGYLWVSPMTRRGNCIGVSMNEGWAIKGQVEDANMAGGGTAYEFWRIDGRWVGKVLTSWIS